MVRSDRLHWRQLKESAASLDASEAHLFGVVLNNITRREAPTYAYYSNYDPDHAPVRLAAEGPGYPAE